MAAAGRLGRKTGQGWYAYPPGRPEDPPAPDPAPRGDGLVVVAGETELAELLLEAAAGVGWDARPPLDADGRAAGPDRRLRRDRGRSRRCRARHQLLLCDAAPLAAQDPGGSAAGFHLPLPLHDGGLVELCRSPTTAPAAAAAAERFFATLGRRAEWVGDAPGLV